MIILGLAIGMACSILILLWVQNELATTGFMSMLTRFIELPVMRANLKLQLNQPASPQD